MLPETTQRLILKLWELTERGVIPWEPAEDGDSHRFETEGYVVEISTEPTTVTILRPDGHHVETATAAALAETGWPRPDATRFDDAVRQLAKRAAQHASGERETVEAVMSSMSTPARNPSNESATPTDKPIFGAIESFDISRRSETLRGATPTPANAPETASTEPTQDEPEDAPAEEAAPREAYSPWLTT